MDPEAKSHTITIDIHGHGDHTHVNLTQDNNATEEVREHSVGMWNMALQGMKKAVEGR
jgi:hypothetical protein